MLTESRSRILGGLAATDLVLDVGGWGRPLARANWVLDLMPYETHGLYGEPDPDPERFSASTWVVRDICDRVPWPFADNQFDFAVCSHTLEDVRDPIWVCSELARVAKAGYIEVPARSEEQTPNVHGPWVGWSHHHWMIDMRRGGLEFVLKPHLLHGRAEFWVDRTWWTQSTAAERVNAFFWEDDFEAIERIFYVPDELHEYLGGVFDRYGVPPAPTTPGSRLRARARGLLRELLSTGERTRVDR